MISVRILIPCLQDDSLFRHVANGIGEDDLFEEGEDELEEVESI